MPKQTTEQIVGTLEPFRLKVKEMFRKKFPQYHDDVGGTGAMNSVLLIACDPNVARAKSYADGFLHALMTAPDGTIELLHFTRCELRKLASKKRGWAYLLLAGTKLGEARSELVRWGNKPSLKNVAKAFGREAKDFRNAAEMHNREARQEKAAMPRNRRRS